MRLSLFAVIFAIILFISHPIFQQAQSIDLNNKIAIEQVFTWSLENEEATVWSNVEWSPDGKRIAALAYPQIYVWDIAEKGLINEIRDANVYDFTWSPDGKYIAGIPNSSSSFSIHIWDSRTGELIQEVNITNPDFLENESKTGWTSQIDWNPNVNTIASTGHWLLLWELDNEVRPFGLRTYIEQGTNIAWNPDGNLLASTGIDTPSDVTSTPNEITHPLQIWNPETQEIVAELGNGVRSVDWSPDGLFLASRSRKGHMDIWRTNGWNKLLTIEMLDSRGAFISNAWNFDSSILASGTSNGMVYLWENITENTKVSATVQAHEDIITDIDWSPTANLLVTSSYDKTLHLWQIKHVSP